MSKIVVALGGNALGNTLTEQKHAVKQTAKAVADLIEDRNQVAIVHGNGPQVGMIQNAMQALTRSDPGRYDLCPLSVCVAMSQAYIGYDLQSALDVELHERNIQKTAATVVTQVKVNLDDPAFQNPTKPIGPFLSREDADKLVQARGYTMVEDAGRGYRRVVASPKPVSIVELETIQDLLDDGHVVIACGGGGIPIVRTSEGDVQGVSAVIDKDFAACMLATCIQADTLLILTAVEKVAINFGKEDELWLDYLTPETAQKYIDNGQFASGSMLPKVQAALQFAMSSPGRQAVITHLNKALDGIRGITGTRILSPKREEKNKFIRGGRT